MGFDMSLSKNLRTVAISALLGDLAACADSPSQSSIDVPDGGWRIAPEGDLNTFFECIEAEGISLISAHRGGPYPGLPENAIETMAKVLKEAPAIMEIDIVTSSDGVLYLMHDDTLDRTTTGAGEVDDLTWAQIKDLSLEDENGENTGFQPPRFDEVLAWSKGRTLLQLDIKRSTRFEDVAAEVRRQNAEESVILIAYSTGAAAKLHRLMPDAMISLSMESQSDLNRAVASGIPKDRLLAFTGTRNPQPRLFSLFDDDDIEVIFGTLGGAQSIDNQIARSGDEALYAEYSEAGVDIIATDRPLEAHNALLVHNVGLRDGLCGVQYNNENNN